MAYRYRSCRNCHVFDITGWRWCDDCTRMIAKTVATEVIAAVVGGLFYLLGVWLTR